ncbi:MAG: geranylgeranyl reductase family protein [Rhodobacteraceae bacterium]|nr:geranylgeranyl reductase family protein [Paracoccaceae bacterium]
MLKFDLIVLGAGPAGSATAATAARAGLRVAIVDKRAFPRDKLCGGGFTGRALAYYQDIFGRQAPDIPTAVSRDLVFGAHGEVLSHYTDIPPISMMMRRDLDNNLLATALDFGAADYTGVGSTALDIGNTEVSFGDTRLHAPVIVAADGVSSPTARALFGKAFDQETIAFALEIERPEKDLPLRIDFGAAEWGYGWQFPKTNGVTIGVGGINARNPDMKAALRRYLNDLGLPDDIAIKGQFLPGGIFRKTPGAGRILLAGDAAGLVDPITGEGIAYAMKSGQLAALATQEALRIGKPDTVLGLYTRSMRPIHRALRQARLIRPLMFQPFLRDGFVAGFRRSTRLRRDYMRLLAGETEYGPITRAALARAPRHVWRSLTAKRNTA